MRDVTAALRAPWQGSKPVMRLLALSVFVVAAATVALSAHAQGHHHRPGGAPGGAMMMFDGPPARASSNRSTARTTRLGEHIAQRQAAMRERMQRLHDEGARRGQLPAPGQR